MRFGAADLAASCTAARPSRSSPPLDQRRVWGAADALRQAEGDLTSEAEAIGSAPEDAAMIDEVEARHFAVEQAADRFETTRRRTFGSAAAAPASPSPACTSPGGRVPLHGHRAGRASLASLLARANVGRAATAEEQALEEAGASSYLGFQLQRVNGLLANDANRKALMDVAGAGAPPWPSGSSWPATSPSSGRSPTARRSRRRPASAARSTRSARSRPPLPTCPSDLTGELAHVLVTRLAEVRSAGGEGVPLVLDDPFRSSTPR